MKRILIAAATTVVLSTAAFAGVAPASAAQAAPSAEIVKVGGNGHWNGGNGNWNNGPDRWNGDKWHGGKGKWQGPPKWKARKSCDPVVQWRLVGNHWNKQWKKVVVGWDCDRGRKHW